MTQNPKTLKASRAVGKVIDRLEIVDAYLSTGMELKEFAELFNTSGVFHWLRTKTGAIDAEALDRWVTICMGVVDGEEAAPEKKAESDAMLIKSQRTFIEHLKETIAEKDEAQDKSDAMARAYKAEITSLQQKIVRDSYLIESLQRFHTALEGKCNYQQELIAELKKQLEALLAATTQK